MITGCIVSAMAGWFLGWFIGNFFKEQMMQSVTGAIVVFGLASLAGFAAGAIITTASVAVGLP